MAKIDPNKIHVKMCFFNHIDKALLIRSIDLRNDFQEYNIVKLLDNALGVWELGGQRREKRYAKFEFRNSVLQMGQTLCMVLNEWKARVHHIEMIFCPPTTFSLRMIRHDETPHPRRSRMTISFHLNHAPGVVSLLSELSIPPVSTLPLSPHRSLLLKFNTQSAYNY